RFFSIALGGAAAQLLDMDQLTTWLKDRVGRFHHFIVDVVLLGLLAILTYGMLHMLDAASFTYYGGMFGFDLLDAVMIDLFTYRDSWVGFLLKFKPLRWLGQRTFHMYLWYYPINVLFHMVPTSQNWFTNSIWPQVILIIILSCLSHALLGEKRWPVPVFN